MRVKMKGKKSLSKWSLTNVKQTVMMWRLFRGESTGEAKIDPIIRTTRHSLSPSVANKRTEIHYHFLNTLLCIADWMYPITSCLLAFFLVFNALTILPLNLLRSSIKWRVLLSMRLYLHSVKAIPSFKSICIDACPIWLWWWKRQTLQMSVLQCWLSKSTRISISMMKFALSQNTFMLYIDLPIPFLHRWNNHTEAMPWA